MYTFRDKEDVLNHLDELMADRETNFQIVWLAAAIKFLFEADIVTSFESKVLRSLRKLEDTTMSNGANLTRLQNDIVTLQGQVTTLTTSNNAAATALAAAIARLQETILALQAAITGDDDAAVGKAADALEAQLPNLTAIQSSLDAQTANDATIDPATQPTTLVISPTTANVAPGGTQSFSANIAVTWSAVSGTIDVSGVYTAPTNVPSDTVTATSADGQTATAAITIG
jgi:hypothetical protein